jgi:diguanylate cyclase (GGDEF)-like protein
VILPNTDSAAATRILDGVLKSVRTLAISQPTSKTGCGIVTLSIGYATVIPDEYDTPAALLRWADQALYQAKASGRDQLRCFGSHESAFSCSRR